MPLAARTPVTWALLVFLLYVTAATALDVTPVFAAFLAGFGLMGGVKGTERQRYRRSMESITAVSMGLFIPLYFALVGFKLDFSKHFSWGITIAFLAISSLVNFGCGVCGARFAGFRGRSTFNIAITGNARGGPGIVLASVAFEAGIISQTFFTALVVTAVVTSQMCGFWLDLVLRKGWSLLGEPDQAATSSAAEPDYTDEHDESEAILA
jgi:Kef-type K+ transport system membrane component KefB